MGCTAESKSPPVLIEPAGIFEMVSTLMAAGTDVYGRA